MAKETDGVIDQMYNIPEQSRDTALIEKAKRSAKMIWVTFRKEGIHKYPAALDDPKLATGDWDDVSFLGYPHRHIFHFKVYIEVFHDDRDIEFIQFKRWLENLYADATLKLDYKSCEMMADELNSIIQQRYEGRGTIIEVSEDGENGCTIMFPPKGKKTEFATYQEMMSNTNPSVSSPGEQ